MRLRGAEQPQVRVPACIVPACLQLSGIQGFRLRSRPLKPTQASRPHEQHVPSPPCPTRSRSGTPQTKPLVVC